MFAKLEVGGIYKEGVTSYKEGVVFSFDESGGILTYFFNDPEEKEIEALRQGEYKLALTEKDGILFLLSKFGQLEWTEAPYSPHLSPTANYSNLSEGQGYALTLVLVDSGTGIIKSIRLIGLSTIFSKSFKKIVEEQLQYDFDRKIYDAKINQIYSRYSTKDLLKFRLPI